MTRSTRSSRRHLVIATAISAAVFAACGGGPPGASGGGSSGPAAPATLSPVVTARACELLTDADIAEITGTTVVSKDDNVVDTVYANHCRWTLQRPDGGNGTFDLGVLSPGGRELYDHTGGASGLDPIEGLPADAAGLDTNTGSIFAVRGDTLVDVFTLSLLLSPEQEVGLARRVLEQLFGLPTATAPGGEPTQAGGGAPGDACDLLTDQDILDITGFAAVGKESTVRVGVWDDQCLWEVDGASELPAALTVTIKSPGGRASWDQYLIPIQGELTAIEGLGDAAFGKAHWPTHVLVGDTYISVQFLDFPDSEGPVNTELARRVVENLGN